MQESILALATGATRRNRTIARSTSGETKGTPTGGITRRILDRAHAFGSRKALIGGRHSHRNETTYEQLAADVVAFAAGLKLLGIGKGSRVGLLSENLDLWILSDLALLALGAVDVPRGGDAPGHEVAFCFQHAQCTEVIVESKEQVEKLAPLRSQLRHVLVLRGDAPEGCETFESVRARGEAALKANPNFIEPDLAAVGDADLATIIYTSGTTGNPKGVQLSHGNILHNVDVIPAILRFPDETRYISFLPSWHTLERTIEYVALDHGMQIHYSSKWTLKQDLQKVRPHFMVGVPRLWETFAAAVLGKVEAMTGAKGALVRGALNGSRLRTDAWRRLTGLAAPCPGQKERRSFVQKLGDSLLLLLLWPPHFVADRLVYRRIRESLGNHLGVAVSGGGPLPLHVDEFLTRAGIPLLNGYGLTESSPVISVRRPKRNRLGTIGTPIPHTEVRIRSEDGRDLSTNQKGIIHAKGPQIMQGYFANEAASALAIDADGWLNTGDIGMLTEEGDVLITGRAKDTIVLRGGENIEPEPIEAVLCSSPLIAECMLVGHGEKILGLLVVPELTAVRRELSLPESTSDAEVIASTDTARALASDVARRISSAAGYRPYERIGHVHVLATPFSVDDGTLTATMKKKRAVIEERYAPTIRALFGP